MATLSGTQRTAELVGEVMHVSSEAAKHTARVLRASGGLWPAPGRGVRSANFTWTHLINLMVAIGCGEPIKAVETVTLFLGMRLDGTPLETLTTWVKGHPFQPEEPTEISEKTRLAPELSEQAADTLGGVFHEMVRVFADPNTSDLRHIYRLTKVVVTMQPSPRAALYLRLGGLTQIWTYRPPPGQYDVPAAGESTLQRTFTGYNCERLAAIWAGTKIDTPTEHVSTNETAAIHPCPGTNAAAPSQPPAERERGRRTPPVLSEREIALNGYAAGPPFIKERPDARYRQLPADSAGS